MLCLCVERTSPKLHRRRHTIFFPPSHQLHLHSCDGLLTTPYRRRRPKDLRLKEIARTASCCKVGEILIRTAHQKCERRLRDELVVNWHPRHSLSISRLFLLNQRLVYVQHQASRNCGRESLYWPIGASLPGSCRYPHRRTRSCKLPHSRSALG